MKDIRRALFYGKIGVVQNLNFRLFQFEVQKKVQPFLFLFTSIFLFATGFSMTAPEVALAAVAPTTNGGVPIIFVPGFKGSRLVDGNGRTAWVNGLNALGYNPESLRLPLMWHPEAPAGQNARADGDDDGLNDEPGGPQQNSIPNSAHNSGAGSAANLPTGSIFSQLDFHKITGTKAAAGGRALPLQFRQAPGGTLRVDGPVGNISVIPWLLDEEVYGPFLKEASKWGRPFYAFSYDWRRDNNESAARLRRYVLKIKRELKTADVDVVCHSMGGLLVFSLMNQEAHLFRKVVFAGTPFHGGVGFMPDMHAGTATGLNKKILSPEVLFSFPSVYTLFPDQRPGAQGALGDTSDAVDTNGNPLVIDYFKTGDWRAFKLGIFAHREVSATEEDFLSHALAQAKIFKDKLALKNTEYPRAMVILGHKFQTLSYMIRNGPKSVLGWDFETHAKVPGDGRVGANNLPPDYLPYDLYYSDVDHGKLLNDSKMIEKIKAYLEITH